MSELKIDLGKGPSSTPCQNFNQLFLDRQVVMKQCSKRVCEDKYGLDVFNWMLDCQLQPAGLRALQIWGRIWAMRGGAGQSFALSAAPRLGRNPTLTTAGLDSLLLFGRPHTL